MRRTAPPGNNSLSVLLDGNRERTNSSSIPAFRAGGSFLAARMSAGMHEISLKLGTGLVAGTVQIRSAGKEIAEVINLKVDPHYRRNGFGRRLVNAAIDTARSYGSALLRLEARPDPGSISNQNLVAMYSSMGFRTVHHSPAGNPVMELAFRPMSKFARSQPFPITEAHQVVAHNRTTKVVPNSSGAQMKPSIFSRSASNAPRTSWLNCETGSYPIRPVIQRMEEKNGAAPPAHPQQGRSKQGKKAKYTPLFSNTQAVPNNKGQQRFNSDAWLIEQRAYASKSIDSTDRTQLSLSKEDLHSEACRTLWVRSKSTANAAVICQMWDSETKQWYKGSCNHRKGQGRVPAKIWREIPDRINPNEYTFGKNCAEVECIIRAFAQKKETDLSGCYFMSYNRVQGKFWAPCLSCRSWIKQFGGVWD